MRPCSAPAAAAALPALLLPWALLLAAPAPAAAARGRGTLDDVKNPVTRVVRLLTEMKEQVEAEAKEDEDIYSKMACWCETNDREKTAAIKEAERRLDELAASIEEGTARSARLTSEISDLKDDIQANQDSVDKAAALREKEKEEYEDASKDMIESIAILKEAVAVLQKVQLLQGKKSHAQAEAAALMQVRELVGRAARSPGALGAAAGTGAYRSVMQKDLWDLLSDLPGGGNPGNSAAAARVVTGLEQQPTGYAAGATSYGSRSSSIFGMLQQMQATFQKDLAQAMRADFEAEVAFQQLRAAKEGEMLASGKSVEEKSAELADTDQRVAQAKADVVDTREALSADEKFLMDLKERCAKADSEYEERKKTRQEEVQAIAEAIRILTEDDARDLFSKTLSFVQTSSERHLRGTGAALQAGRGHQQLTGRSGQQERVRAASRLLAALQRRGSGSGGWRLATLAVGVQLDGFEKVKEAMDKMIAELKKQQQEEYEKHESCMKDIDANEDDTREKQSEKRDLEAQIAGLEGTLEGLKKEIAELNAKVAEAHVALKAAGEQRQAENHEFQQVVADQRATVAILQQALQRLRAFYASSETAAALVSTWEQGHRQEPGAAAPPPPPAGKAYSKSGTSGGVLQMLEKIIQDAEKADQEAVLAEQASQNAYTQLVANVNVELDVSAKAISEKTGIQLQAEADKLLASQSLRNAEATLANLASRNKALHLDCDYLLKNFAVRQQARQEEVEAIQEAKAILSGADFGGEA